MNAIKALRISIKIYILSIGVIRIKIKNKHILWFCVTSGFREWDLVPGKVSAVIKMD